VHTPAEQTFPGAHGDPHPPQLLLSVCGSMHFPLQALDPLGQTSWHPPPEQIWPAVQTVPPAQVVEFAPQ